MNRSLLALLAVAGRPKLLLDLLLERLGRVLGRLRLGARGERAALDLDVDDAADGLADELLCGERGRRESVLCAQGGGGRKGEEEEKRSVR